MSKTIILKPRVSEKGYAQSEALNTYLFEVTGEVNRHDVARAVTAQYEVTVTGVRMASTPGKTRRTYKKRGRVSHKGRSSSVHKAYVTLKEGDSLPIFATVDEATDKRPLPVQEGR
jgi:ribosomal protein L23